MILLIEFVVALTVGILLAVALERLTQRRTPNYGKLGNLGGNRRDFDVFLKSIKKKAI
jgi:hypothetical protein